MSDNILCVILLILPLCQCQNLNLKNVGWGWKGQNHSDITMYLEKIANILSFLSFGIFLLNLLLNALLFGNSIFGITTATYPTYTYVTTGTGTARDISQKFHYTENKKETLVTPKVFNDKNAYAELVSRFRREASLFEVDRISIADGMAATFIQLIRAVNDSSSSYTLASLCNANRKAMAVGKGFQLLMPIFSISISWEASDSPQYNFSEKCQAVIKGLRNENCFLNYMNNEEGKN